MIIHAVGAEFFHADGRTDLHDVANGHFWKCDKAHKKPNSFGVHRRRDYMYNKGWQKNIYILTFQRLNVIRLIYGNSPYRAVNSFYQGHKNQSVNDE